jgi:methyltransferase (TIGR00027 family)
VGEVGSRGTAGEPYDPIVPLLIDDGILQKAEADRGWQQDPLTAAIRSHVVLRSRYEEDCLYQAAQSGVQQYVLLGSGFDTFAYRQPAWAANLRIFEVDHPASQRLKMDRLRLSGVPHPANLECVAADFEASSLRDILTHNSSLDFHALAFFSCLGVLVCLPQASITPIFQLIASFTRRWHRPRRRSVNPFGLITNPMLCTQN